jgi:hypothetical protein
MRSLLLLAIALALLGGACGDSATDASEPSISDAQLDEIVLSGRNQTGLVEFGRDDWRRVAERACAEGAWEADVRERIVTAEGLDRNVDTADAAVVLIQIVALVCPQSE